LSKGELNFKGALAFGDDLLYRGDRVMFTKNNPQLGVVNGDQGTIEVTHTGGPLSAPSVQVRLDRTKEALWWARAIRVTVPLGAETNMRLGYATTVHKAQGATVDRAFVLGGGWMEDRETAYVQMSRSRGATHIYVTEAEAGEDLAEMSRRMTVTRAKVLAHNVQEQRDSPILRM
jgi:ATP-dependent exoDNAse (exonuclease V) alpha subunit